MGYFMDRFVGCCLHSRRFRAVYILLSTAILTIGCTDLPEPDSRGAADHGGTGSENGMADDDRVEEAPGSTGNALAVFPADVHGDDRTGLIVTGLDGLSAEDVVSPWLAVTRVFRSLSDPDHRGDSEIELVRYADDFPVAAHREYLDLPIDHCRAGMENADRETVDENPPPPTVSGGATVVFNTPSGPWFTFQAARNTDQQIVYSSQNRLPAAFPEDITLSIPGSLFPTVSAHPLYEPQPVERLSPETQQTVTADSRLQWVAGQGNTLIRIDWLAFDDNDVFTGFPLTCLVKDDGEFALDSAARSALTDRASRLAVRYSRIYARLDVINGVVLYQEVEIAE